MPLEQATVFEVVLDLLPAHDIVPKVFDVKSRFRLLWSRCFWVVSSRKYRLFEKEVVFSVFEVVLDS